MYGITMVSWSGRRWQPAFGASDTDDCHLSRYFADLGVGGDKSLLYILKGPRRVPRSGSSTSSLFSRILLFSGIMVAPGVARVP